MQDRTSFKRNLIVFLRTIAKSLLPDGYSELTNRRTKDAFSYFYSMVFFAFFLMIIIAIPKILLVPSYITEQLSLFDTFTVDVNVQMKEPIIFTRSDPQVTIDLASNATTVHEGKILITHDYVLYKSLFHTKRIELDQYHNILDNKETIGRILLVLMILILPSIMVIAYFTYLIKYAIIIMIGSGVMYLGAKIRKHDVTFKKVYKTAIYASTIMVITEVLAIPYLSRWMVPVDIGVGFSIAIIPLLLFVVYLIFGILVIAKKEIRFNRKGG